MASYITQAAKIYDKAIEKNAGKPWNKNIWQAVFCVCVEQN